MGNVRWHPDGKTLFAGMYNAKFVSVLKKDRPKPHMEGIDKGGSCDVYDVRIDPKFADLCGKLFIQWGSGARAWVQRADGRTSS